MTDQAQVKLIWKAQDTKSSKTDLKVKEETVKKTRQRLFPRPVLGVSADGGGSISQLP